MTEKKSCNTEQIKIEEREKKHKDKGRRHKRQQTLGNNV